MAALTTQYVNLSTGLTPAYVSATGGGDTALCGNDAFLVVVNGGGSSITVTLAAPGNNFYGQANPDPAITVANGTTKFIGPLRADAFADPTDGRCHITYSGVTSVTVGVVSL